MDNKNKPGPIPNDSNPLHNANADLSHGNARKDLEGMSTLARYVQFLRHIKVLCQRAPNGAKISFGPIAKEYRVSHNIAGAMESADVITRAVNGTRSGLTFWALNDDITDVVGQKVIDAAKDIANAYQRKTVANRKETGEAKGTGGRVTSNVKAVRVFDKTKVEDQILWIDQQIAKEDQIPGYLRPGESDILREVQHTLRHFAEVAELIPFAVDGLNRIADKIHGSKQ